MLDARRERPIEPGAIEDQGRIGHAFDRFQRREQRIRVGHLRHALGMDERAHLDAPEASRDERFDERELLREREDALFVLQSVAQRFVFDQDFRTRVSSVSPLVRLNRC